MLKISREELRMLCIKNDWFTCGTNQQYYKLFEALEKGYTLEVIAAIIWVCSDGDKQDIISTLEAYASEKAESVSCDNCTDRGHCPEYTPGAMCVNDRR